MNEKRPQGRDRPIRHRAVGIGEDIDLRGDEARLDRLKLSLPWIEVNPAIPSTDFYDLLRRHLRQSQASVSLTRKGNKIFCEFKESHWHFALKVRLVLADDRWSGAATVELNAMRLFGSIIQKRDLYRNPELSAADLIRHHGVAPIQTLDEADNFIAKEHLGWANACDWPEFCQRYVQAVVHLSHEVFTQSDKLHIGMPGLPLLELPPTGDWVWSEVEVCYEFWDEDATSRVAELSRITLGLARKHSNTNHGKPKTRRLQDVDKFVDMHSTRIALTKTISLAFYAKAMDRLRVEVRYKTTVLKSCKLVQSDFRRSSKAIEDVLFAVCADATRRLNKALTEVRAKMAASNIGVFPLSQALTFISTACAGNQAISQHLISAFMRSQGIAASSNPKMQEAIEALLRDGVLVKAKMHLRSNWSQYVLSQPYVGSFAACGRGLGLAIVEAPTPDDSPLFDAPQARRLK